MRLQGQDCILSLVLVERKWLHFTVENIVLKLGSDIDSAGVLSHWVNG